MIAITNNKLENYVLNNLYRIKDFNFAEYIENFEKQKSFSKEFFILKNKNSNPSIFKANRKEIVFIDFILRQQELESLVKNSTLFSESMKTIELWNQYTDRYKKDYEKNQQSCLNIKLKGLSLESYTLIMLFIEFGIHHLFLYFNNQVNVVYEHSPIIRYYDDTHIQVQIEITHSRLSIQDYFNNLYANLFDAKTQKIKKETIVKFIQIIEDSFNKELFMNNNQNLKEEHKEELFEILDDKENPLHIYLVHLLENEKPIDDYFKQIKSNDVNYNINFDTVVNKMNGPKKRFSLFNRKEKEPVVIEEDIISKEMKKQEEMIELMESDTFFEFKKEMMDIELSINLCIRLNEKYGLYIQSLLLKDLKLITSQFKSNQFSLKEKSVIINDLLTKFKSFHEIIKLIIPASNNDSLNLKSENSEDKLKQIRDILKL